MSQAPVRTERARPPHTRRTVAARTATYSSVACTSWPPGAQTAPATWPASYSSAVRTSRTWRFSRAARAPRGRGGGAGGAPPLRAVPEDNGGAGVPRVQTQHGLSLAGPPPAAVDDDRRVR